MSTVIEIAPTEIVEPVVTAEPEPMINMMVQQAWFMEDCVKVVLGDGVVEVEKLVSHTDFARIISEAVNVQSQVVGNKFLMPSNCFYFETSAAQIKLSVYYPEASREMKYQPRNTDLKVIRIRVPNIIVSITLNKDRGENNWQVADSRWFCTDRTVGQLPKTFIGEPNHRQKIFPIPFTNTYEQGRMCYGGNVMPAKYMEGNLRGLDWYFQYLFEAPFNDDLGIVALGGDTYPHEWYETLRKTAEENKPFPYNRLRNFST